MSGNNDEIDFLLSDVNSGSQKKQNNKKQPKVISSRNNNSNNNNNLRDQPTISSPLSIPSIPTRERTNDDEDTYYATVLGVDRRQMLYYFLAGFGALLLTMFAILSIGLLISESGALITWVFLWVLVCGGGLFCLVKKPLALNICNGVAGI